MKNIIFCFTGTGNSLSIAKDIAAQIDGTEIVAVWSETKPVYDLRQYERVGFVFPIYYYYMPSVFEHFICNLQFTKTHYIFGVASFGGAGGVAVHQLRELIHSGGGILKGEFSVRMPGNYIVEYGAFPQFLQATILAKAKNKVKIMVTAIQNKQMRTVCPPNLYIKSFSGYAQSQKMLLGTKAADFYSNSNCIGCGICQRLCPMKNITMEADRPKWGTACEQCMACIQWCPKLAVDYLSKTLKRKRYHNPDVHLSELYKDYC